MANARREFLRKSKRARMKELKVSQTGVTSVICSIGALAFTVLAISYAFIFRGEGDIMTACFGLMGLVFSIGSILLGLKSIKEPAVRTSHAKFGTIMGVVVTIALMGFYISGFVA